MKTILLVVLTTFLFASCSKEETTEDYNYNNYNSGGGSGCPTTAACGCSNKTKSECESSPCCRWTVGQGCGCR